jgi:outer membrane protein assembly factor BamB
MSNAEATLVPGVAGSDPTTNLKLETVDNPLPRATLGAFGKATKISGPAEFGLTILLQPYDPSSLTGLDPLSTCFFKWDEKSNSLQKVWNSGVNPSSRSIWAKISSPGVYIPISLPEDPLLRESLFRMANERKMAYSSSADEMKRVTLASLDHFLSLPDNDLAEVRDHLSRAEASAEPRRGRSAHVVAPPLPGNASLAEFRDRIKQLDPPPAGLAEESLFHTLTNPAVVDGIDKLNLPLRGPIRFPCRFISQDWWMYHHDQSHSGAASGCSGITSTNVAKMTALAAIPLDGSVITIPCIVQGNIYVGTVNNSKGTGTLYNINLATGAINGSYVVPDTDASGQGYTGIGGSPAVVGGNIYFTSFGGFVYCVDSASMTLVWSTDLNTPSKDKNQPVSNPNADTWSSPLVVNGKVYVGTGEGEAGGYGFVWCLDAAAGHVQWLFCTNQFSGGNDSGQTNLPNVIPKSCTPGGVLPAWATMFSVHADPPHIGCSPWSSLAYDSSLNKVFLGTGNSYNDGPLPDSWYGSGAMGLDADTGIFGGYNAPQQYDSYYPGDSDADMPSSPVLFTRGTDRVLCIGSKIGSFFIYDAKTMGQLNSRQLLPKDAVTGAQLPNVDPGGKTGGENMYGIFGTAAVHTGLKRIFVALGGWGGAIDHTTTPFVRALNWSDLSDAWPTKVNTVGANKVSMYNVGPTPLYATPNEIGLSSPGVVNDVVFVSTWLPALYAFDAQTGLHLWTAPGLPSGPSIYILGPAIYGNYVVIGYGANLYRFQLP